MPFPGEDIQGLIEGCQQNHRKSQEALYKRFYHAMMILCVRYAGNEQDAIEILNDGFLKAFTHIGKYDKTKAGFYTWLRRIIINSAIDHLRKKREHINIDGIPDLFEEPSIENDALQKLSGEELLRIVRQLPDATRCIFNLYTIDGFSHREISIIMKISEGTSRWHLSEARRQLRSLITLMEMYP